MLEFPINKRNSVMFIKKKFDLVYRGIKGVTYYPVLPSLHMKVMPVLIRRFMPTNRTCRIPAE